MLDHTGIVGTDLAKARGFYDPVAAALSVQTADNGDQLFLPGRSARPNLSRGWWRSCGGVANGSPS